MNTTVNSLCLFLLREQAEHFQLSKPDFPVVQELEEDLVQYEQTWSLYEEYSNALGEMANEDWISFRLVYPVGLVQWTPQYGHVFVPVVAILYNKPCLN